MFRKRRPDTVDASQSVLRCSFCNKDETEVRKLIAGPTVFICDECVEICRDIIAGRSASQTIAVEDSSQTNVLPNVPASGPPVQCVLCRMPIILSDGVLIDNGSGTLSDHAAACTLAE